MAILAASKTIMTVPNLKTLNYIFASPSVKRSLNPLDSDDVSNSTHMKLLVGTLIKYNAVNSYTPFLAEKWVKDEKRTTWTFQLKKGLTCEDGTPIDASQYIKGLHLAFRNHSFELTTPVFSELYGWKE